MKGFRGFTLIELLIALVIVAVLAAIAVPNYREHVKKAHRARAVTFIKQYQNWQEKRFLSLGAYATGIDDAVQGLGVPLIGGIPYIDDGAYEVLLETAPELHLALWANPAGPMRDDETCAVFRGYLDGRILAENAGAGDSTEQCVAR